MFCGVDVWFKRIGKLVWLAGKLGIRALSTLPLHYRITQLPITISTAMTELELRSSVANWILS